MISYTTKYVNFISLIISIIIFILINNLRSSINKIKFQVNFNSGIIQEDISIYQNFKEEEKTTKETANSLKTTEDWKIEIPSISLVAEISEGTTQEVMKKYVGHFEDTALEKGNIGLAAHNRGYEVNFFENLKNLEYGAEIIYKYKDFTMKYEVESIEIIENTNWNYLNNTEDNRITLITCVENEPKYRRCIQGIEKVEREDF